MAYTLRYYKEIKQKDGSVFRLEIHKKDSTAFAVEIGAVMQGLSLEIQGQQGDIDTPIVKTSLSMTFVDAGDIEDGRKNGFWEEFYTPDALLWKVILKAKDATENVFRTIWGGYVTPDSYSESLVYRGSVNIIARDNIGHMQDFPFDASGDADGLVSLYNLVNAGWEKIESPMSLSWRGDVDEAIWLQCEGVPAYDTLMNVSAFEGKNWYETIESALASYGLVMRYVGDNVVQVSSLRYMPYQGKESMDLLPRIEPKFIAGAQREFVPAVRRIEESVSYELENEASMPQLEASDFTGEVLTYRCEIKGIDLGYGEFGTAEHDAPVWPISPARGWNNVDTSTLFFYPDAYSLGYFSQMKGIGDEIYRYMYVAANNVDARNVTFTKTITCSDLVIRMRLGLPCNLDSQYRIEQQTVFNLKQITYALILEQNGVTLYYGKDGWSSNYREVTVEYDATSPSFGFEQYISMGENVGMADLTFCIVKIEYAQTTFVGNMSKYGLYACIQDLSFGVPESTSLLKDNTVNTVYNAENNIILGRTPQLGPAYNIVALPGLIKNGIFYRDGNMILPARTWAWSGGTPQQMAVYNHLQLLCYYAKPNNQISGTIVNADITRVRAIYEWHGKEHLLVSGRYDFLTGFIEGAVLREFVIYDDMWGEVSEALLPDTEENSKSNIEDGTLSGSSSSTYSNTTTVNIGTGSGGGTSYLNDLYDVDIDGATAKSILYFDGNTWIDKNIATILDEVLQAAKAIAGWFKKDDNGDIYTDVNFYSLKTVASGGKGTVGTGGTGTVNGIVFEGDLDNVFVSDSNGIITLPSYPKGALASKDNVEWSDIVGLDKGTSSQFLKGDGSLDSTKYVGVIDDILNVEASNIILSVDSGLTLSSSEDISLSSFDTTRVSVSNSIILALEARTNTSSYISFSNSEGLKGYIGFDADGLLSYRTYNGINYSIIHKGNLLEHVGDSFLPLTGGTIKGTGNYVQEVLSIDTDNQFYTIFSVKNQGELKGRLEWTPDTDSGASVAGFGLYNATTREKLHLSDNGGVFLGINPLLHSGNYATQIGDYYLKSSGGAMTGSITIDSWTVFGVSGTNFYLGSPAYPLLLRSNGTTTINGNTLLHSGNYSNYALPLTGGTISNTHPYLLHINNTSGGDAIIQFNNETGGIGFSPTDSSMRFFHNGGGYPAIRLVGGKSAPIFRYDSKDYDILHSGNANKADTPWTASNILFPEGTSATWNVYTIGAYKGITVLNAVQAKPEGAPDPYAVGLSVSGYYGFTLASLGAGDFLLYRRKNETDWRTIAFIDSDITGNAASATKLETTRTIWGQSFDGTGNIDGSLYFGQGKAALYAMKPNGTANMIFAQVNPEGKLLLGQQIAQNGYDTNIYGNNINFCYGTAGSSSSTAIKINSSGNVTIGSGDFAGTNAKLATLGNVRIYRSTDTNTYLDINCSDVSVYYNGYDSDGYCHHYFQSNGATRLMINGSTGNVGIGTTNPQYKLDVSGTGHFTGAMTLDSTLTAGATTLDSLTVTGDARLKGSGSYGNVLYFGDGSYCYLHEDTDDHLTIYADNGITMSDTVAASLEVVNTSYFKGNTTHKAIAYFANGTSYYISAAGAAKFASLTSGAITASGLITANAGATIPQGQKLTIGGVTLEWDSASNALKVTGNMYTTGTLASGAKGSTGTVGGALTGDLMPSLNYTYNIGDVNQYYKYAYANSFLSGAPGNNLNLYGGTTSSYGIRFRLTNFTLDSSGNFNNTELGYWKASGLVVSTKLYIGSVDVGAKLADLESRLTAIGG